MTPPTTTDNGCISSSRSGSPGEIRRGLTLALRNVAASRERGEGGCL